MTRTHVMIRKAGAWVERGRTSVVNLNPSPPSGFDDTAVTTTTATLVWVAASVPDPVAAPLLGYRIYEDTTVVATIAAPATTTTLTGLTAGSIHDYTLVAYNSAGESGSTPVLTVTLTPTGGGTGTPGAPTSIAVSNLATNDGFHIAWGDPAAGGGAPTGVRVYRGGTTLVVDLGPTLRIYDNTGLTAPVTRSFTVRYYNATGEGPASAAATGTLGTVTSTGSPAGVVKNRVLIGITGPESGPTRPLFDTVPTNQSYDTAAKPFGSAMDIISGGTGRKPYTKRTFVNNGITLADLNAGLANGDNHGILPIVSFKESAPLTIASGGKDSLLKIIRDAMIARRKANGGSGKPAWISNQHEPSGNGYPLADWGKMHAYCSNYFAGYSTNTTGANLADGTKPWYRIESSYVAANDVRDIMTWISIGNGFMFGGGNATDLNDCEPAFKSAMFALNGSIATADIYDPFPNGNTGGDGKTTRVTWKATADRPGAKLQQMVDFFRPKGVLTGAGEVGTADGPGWTDTWKVARANRDIVVALAYFDSGNGSKFEWRLIPSNYPKTSLIAFKTNNCVPEYTNEVGGTIFTAERLAAYQTSIDESTTAAYTSAP